MQTSRSYLLASIVLALVTQFGITGFKSKVKDVISARIETDKKHDIRKIKSMIFLTLSDSEIMNGYEVEDYIGSHAQGVILDVTKSKQHFVAKVIIDTNAELSFCKREKVVEELNSKRISYVTSLRDYQEYTGKSTNPQVFSCVLIFDKPDDTITSLKLFKDNDNKGKIENSKKLFIFFGKLIQAFTEINLKNQVLHGNITPDSIMVKFNQTDKNSAQELEPVVSDFCYSLKNEKFEFIPDKLFRYSDNFRPPEMIEKTKAKATTSNENKNQSQKKHKEKDKDKEKKQKQKELEKNWDKNWEKYQYSNQFVEDVYALGKTIQEVLKIQSDFIKESLCEIQSLRAIIKLMLQDKEMVDSLSKPENYTKGRMNMRQITVEFIGKVNDCDSSHTNTIYQLFIKQATGSINSFRIPFILI